MAYTPGKSKEYIRNSVFLFFNDCKHVITLPNLYFGLEQMLLDDGKKVDCTEFSVNTFEGAKQIAPKEVKLYNKNVKDLDISKYDGLFLDFYGCFNDNCRSILPRINSGSKVALTFLMARESKKLQKEIDIKNREESYVNLLSKYNIKVLRYVNYCDTTPMCVFYGIKQ